MKGGKQKIAYRYTCLTVGVVTLVSILFYLCTALFRRLLPLDGLGLFAAFLLVNGAGVYWAARRYANEMTAWTERAYQSEKSFISNASHELNNPLTAIQGECEISLMRERSPSESQRIIGLMKHLMFLSKGEDEILKTDSRSIVLAEFLMQFVEKRIQFSPDNFAFMLDVNPYLLKTALANIIGNALKYSGDKIVEIKLRGAVLEIADQGIGIPPEELSRVVQPFYRAGNTRRYAGNGIGLSLSARILHVYGAEVSISSVLNEGTRVRIDFQHVK